MCGIYVTVALYRTMMHAHTRITDCISAGRSNDTHNFALNLMQRCNTRDLASFSSTSVFTLGRCDAP